MPPVLLKAMGRRKRCASDGGSGAESKCYTTCAALELHEHSFLFLTHIANLQDYRTRQLRDEVINNEQDTSVEVFEEKKGDAVLVFKRLLYHDS